MAGNVKGGKDGISKISLDVYLRKDHAAVSIRLMNLGYTIEVEEVYNVELFPEIFFD